jgi:hypothetical protein
MIDNLITTWGELAPNEFDSGPDEMNLVVFVINCLSNRGWSWNLSGDSGARFTVTVEDGNETYPYPTLLSTLLTAYLTALAVRRPVKEGTHWRHYKGDLVEVVATAKWAGPDLRRKDLKKFPASCRGEFLLEENVFGTVPLIVSTIKTGAYAYIANQDYGERVFYQHHGRNWARPICDFLGLTQDGQLRFVEENNDKST